MRKPPPWVVGLAVILALGGICHLLFSWMGFNPSDEGFYLAAARRVADGQVPHHDFWSLRPMGVAVLYAPIARWGGDSVFWVERLCVWIEHALIAWAWVTSVDAATGRQLGMGARVALTIVAFAAGVAHYPIYLTTTVEALTFCALGVAVLATRRRDVVGYVLLGCAVVCRQNFLLVGPVALVAFNDWRRLRDWAAWALPGAAYVVWVATAGPGSLAAMGAQFAGRADLLHFGVATYVRHWQLWIGLIAGVAAVRTRTTSLLAGLAVLLVIAGLRSTVYPDLTFALFGAAVAVTAGAKGLPRAVGVMALICAWSASISLGLNAPTLGAGGLVALLVATAWDRAWAQRASVALWVAATLAAVVFVRQRRGPITVDAPARALTCPVWPLMPGTKHLYTDPKTCAMLADLSRAIAGARGQPIALLPDYAAYWVAAPQANPLPIDWPWDGELTSVASRDWVTRVLDADRGHLIVILARDKISGAIYGTFEVPPDYSTPDTYVREHWTRIGQTAFFDLYE